jgi:hypothetical protein
MQGHRGAVIEGRFPHRGAFEHQTRFGFLGGEYPSAAAARIASKLTAAHIGYCIEKAPEAMLKHAYDYLTLSQIAYRNSTITQS